MEAKENEILVHRSLDRTFELSRSDDGNITLREVTEGLSSAIAQFAGKILIFNEPIYYIPFMQKVICFFFATGILFIFILSFVS